MGLYLLVERPEDAIRRSEPKAVSMFRKRYNNDYEPKYIKQGVDAWKIINEFIWTHRIKNVSLQYSAYDELVDLKAYMRWLSFNSLVQNADNTDEIYFYEIRDIGQEIGYLKLMGWDCDDLQRPPSHPSNVLKHALLWASENSFDKDVIKNDMLMTFYKKVLLNLLTNKLTPQYLEKTLNTIQSELDAIPFDVLPINNQESKIRRKIEIQHFLNRMLERRDGLISYIKETES